MAGARATAAARIAHSHASLKPISAASAVYGGAQPGCATAAAGHRWPIWAAAAAMAASMSWPRVRQSSYTVAASAAAGAHEPALEQAMVVR